jgi:O-antigen biosynthesis protein
MSQRSSTDARDTISPIRHNRASPTEEVLSHQLIICGMHRSGTSLVASVLQRAGLDIGRDLSGSGLGNPRGHFEDQDFFRLHEDMLAVAGESCFTVGDEFAPPQGNGFEHRARALTATRKVLPLWGWKDPRTCLFLGFWDSILPEARYLLLYRHPVDVALSLWRRNTDLELRQDPWLAIHAWEVYNRRLLDFHRRHVGRCFLAHVPALITSFGGFLHRLRDKLGLPLHDGYATSVFVPGELTPPVPLNPAWEELIPGPLALYRRLEESADLPAVKATAPGSAQPTRERELLRASETLLYALLEQRAPGGPAPPREQREVYYRLREQEEKNRARIPELEAALSHERRVRSELQAELEEERRRSAALAAALHVEQQRSAAAVAHHAEAIRVLASIEGSHSFAPVRAWWWLRRRLGRQRT